MSILILALFAAAPTPQPGEVKTFKDWTVACDNIRFCTAELLDDEESSEAYNEISLTRSGIAGAPVAIDAAVDTTRGDAVLAVDGAVVQSLGTAKKSGVSGVLTLATLARMVQGDQIEIRIADAKTFEVQRDRSREDALDRLRKLRRPLPSGFVFDRDEANAR